MNWNQSNIGTLFYSINIHHYGKMNVMYEMYPLWINNEHPWIKC
jgi:hypothetical protein